MSQDNLLDRRTLLVLAAASTAAALAPSCAVAQVGNEFPNKGRAVTGPGVPVPTKVVATRSGPVQGLIENGVHTFRGIRYGAPPVGKLRFMPPQPPQPWTQTQDCTDFGPPSFQRPGDSPGSTRNDFHLQTHRVYATPSLMKIQSEDCLYLNVWTPGTDAGKRPVILWCHGGGFDYGSGQDPVYHGDDFARHSDVVVVTVNHRLNVFGYLHLSDLMGADYASSGTVGMQDLVLAAKWVRDNIAAFGGDPDNVTLMGQSGGGVKVSTMLAMPAAKGLFHKAVIQSGPGVDAIHREEATAMARRVLDELGIKPGDRSALEAIPAQTLLAAAYKLNIALRPVVDGVELPRDPFAPDAPEVSADIPILMGWTKDELTILSVSEPWFGELTEAQLQERVRRLGPDGQRLLDAIRKEFPNYSPTFLWIQMTGLNFFKGTQIMAARKAAQGRAPVYLYQFSWESPAAEGVFKAAHGLEIPLVFYNFRRFPQFVGAGPGAERVADQMNAAWTSFARTGKPTIPGGPAWPAFNIQDRPVMDINLTSRLVHDPMPGIRQVLEQDSAVQPSR